MQDANELDSVNDGLSEALSSMPADMPAEAGGDQGQSEDTGGQPRDDHGRFAARQEAEAEQASNVEKPKASDDEERDTGAIPAWRLRELREERDRIAAAHEADRRELEAMRRQQAEWQRQQQQPEPEPDPYGDPDGYRAWIQSQQASLRDVVSTEMRNYRVNMTFADVHEQHGEKFEAAYEALQKAPQNVKDEVMSAVHPGKALMRWHGRQTAMTAIGDDFDGFLTRKQEEWLKDPKVRERLLAEMNAEARGGDGGRSENVTSLPSLNRAPGGGGRQTPGDLGSTDAEIFANLTRKRSA